MLLEAYGVEALKRPYLVLYDDEKVKG